MMTTNLFVIANVKQLRTYIVLEFYCLFSEHLWFWRPKFTNFKHFSQSGSVWHDFGGPSKFRGGGGVKNPPWSPPNEPQRGRVFFFSGVFVFYTNFR